MKNFLSQKIFFSIGVFIWGLFFANASGLGQTISEDAFPNLRGDKAVENLKKTGQYDSLIEAVKAARNEDGQPDEPQIDPAIGQNIKLTASDGAANDKFGVSVALSGNTAVIGSYLDQINANSQQGSAYVFIRNGTTWEQQAKLTASDGAAFDRFGIEVAIYDNKIIVGAYLDDIGANQNQGSAYIFTRSGSAWIQQAKLTALDGAANDQFGYSVSVYGNTAVVGAYADTVGTNSGQGSAYIFVGSGATWTQQTKLTALDGAVDDNFGFKVSIFSDTVLVGSPNDDIASNTDQGSAYVFVRSGAIWNQQQKLSASDGASDDQFGFSVGISGETAIVGAYANNIGSNNDQGSAYIFVRNSSIWTQQANLTALDGQTNARFGISVAINGDFVVVGAYFHQVGANSAQGAAYVFTRTGAIWSKQAQLTASDGATGDVFGISVALESGNIIVSANLNDIGANIDQGSVYAFRYLSQSWMQEDQKGASDGAANDQFGSSVAINGETAIVGSIFDDVGANADQGSAYIFVRTGTNWTQQAKLTASDGAAGDRFGVDVAIYGETAIVGANRNDVGPNTDQGSAYIFVRSGTTWIQQAHLTASDGANGDQFGFGVTIFGETAMVGAINDDTGSNADQGSVYVFTRSGTTWTQQTKLTAMDGAANDLFGVDLEINGETAIIGAHLDDIGANTDQGSAYIFIRSGSIWTQQAKLTASDGVTSDFFGRDVAISGDTALVGAYFDDVGTVVGAGSAYIFTRLGSTWAQQQKLTASDGGASDFFGINVSIDGDTAIIGASQDDIGANTNQGSAYVFARSNGVWAQMQKLTASNGAINDLFGIGVGVSGDKIVVSAWLSDLAASNPLTANGNFVPTATDQGTAYFFINNLFAPTAASVSISGRVITSSGAGLRNAIVYLTKADGETISTRTSSFGYFRFDELSAGQTVVISVNSKIYQFTPQMINLTDDLTDLDFIALE